MESVPALVSVIIPCYNVSEYVEKAIRSIVDQTYSNLEIWIIDDASTDDTLDKILSIKDERINVQTYKQNTKKIGAVNDVLRNVKGELICFQDADDWSEPDRIAKQVMQFQLQNKLGICFTNYQYVGAKINSLRNVPITNSELKDEFLEFGDKKYGNLGPTVCGTMMISRAALKSTGGYHPFFAGRVGEDIHWVYRILKLFEGVSVDQMLYNYRRRAGSFTEIQLSGLDAKYAYSWQLLTKVIYKDVHENTDLLAPENGHMLKEIELEACEEALVENIKLVNATKNIYEGSRSFRLGKLLLSPFRLFSKLLKS